MYLVTPESSLTDSCVAMFDLPALPPHCHLLNCRERRGRMTMMNAIY
jgi:hypothetical protein